MKRRKFLFLGSSIPIFNIPILTSIYSTSLSHGVIDEAPRKTRVVDNYDVIVCGGGPAGVPAAIESGRAGAKTLLVEAHGCLGGVWTAGLLTWILDQKNKTGFMRELEIKLIDLGGNIPNIDTGGTLSFDPEIMKFLLEDLCRSANVDILFHSRVVASAKNEYNKLTHVITESKSGREAWNGKIFIDTTGDGDLSALSGCGYDIGRKIDNAIQPFSMLAIVGGINFKDIKEFSRWAGDSKAGSPSKKKLLEEIIKGGILPSYLRPGLYPIREDMFMLMANHEYGYSPLNARDVSKATLEGRREVHNIVRALRENGGVWENIQIIATAEQIGTREGRRIHGLYTLSEDDLRSGARFEDAVCRVTFGVDVHSVSSKDEKTKGEVYNKGIKSKDYDIPLRSLIARDVGGLMMAGRCISGDFIAHSSYRVTGNAVAMGQAVGRVSAYASSKGYLPQDVQLNNVNLD